jgi:hypothetical protein
MRTEETYRGVAEVAENHNGTEGSARQLDDRFFLTAGEMCF